MKAFTLVEVLTVIALMGIIGVVSTGLIIDSEDERKFEATLQEMNAIKRGMIGDPRKVEIGERVHFGFLGDVGALPTNISDLQSLPGGYTSWTILAAVRFSHGWNGPYLDDGIPGVDYTTDEWGNAYVWTPGGTPPTLVSYGADGAAGGSDFDADITISFETEDMFSTVTGRVSTRGSPLANTADVIIAFADGTGAFDTRTDSVTLAEEGAFSFANMYFGEHAIAIYIPSFAAPTTTVGPIRFIVDKPNYEVPPKFTDTDP